jgi:amino acid adenylation domain-containing protein
MTFYPHMMRRLVCTDLSKEQATVSTRPRQASPDTSARPALVHDPSAPPAGPDGPPQLSEAKRRLLEQRLRGAARPAAPAIAPRPAGAAPPLSYAQERLWFMEQFAPGTAAYGSPLLVRLGPDADLAALAAALRWLAARHESLRMRFPATGGRPSVVVDPPGDVPLPVLDVPDEAAAAEAVQTAALRPFDLAAGPLLRALVVRVAGGTRHDVLIDMHHIVTDGWSNDILLAGLSAAYQAAARHDPLPDGPAVTQYGDFAAWQREQLSAPGARPHLEYWLDLLRGVPALELPTDAPRPPAQTFAGASHWFRLDAGLVSALTRLGRTCQATLFMTMLAGYQLVLSRYSGQDCFCVGTPVAGRSRPELDQTIGMFVNMLPLRADVTGDPPVSEFIGRVRDRVLGALAHQDVPFEKVIKELGVPRDVTRPALFQAMIVLQNYLRDHGDDGGQEAGLPWKPVELPATRFDLELHAYPLDGGLQCRFVYNTALFERPAAARLADALTAVLNGMTATPQARIGDLDLVPPDEAAMLSRWNATATGPGEQAWPAMTLPELFARQAARTPEATAVAGAGCSLSYAGLHQAARRIGARLRAAGAGGETIVAVLAERSADLVAALLGVHAAGAAYLPLDPEYPAGRLEYMLTDSGARLVLAQRHLAGALPASGPPVLFLDDAAQWPDAGDAAAWPAVPPGAAAYLIYTSGSTGRPKGVVNTHRGVVNRLEWMQSALPIGPGDAVLQKTPASFDVSAWEFFWPLITGARLALARPGGHRDPAYLREAIESFGVTVAHFVPSMLAGFLADLAAAGGQAGAARCATIRHIVCSGEELPAELARSCLATLPWASLHNLYGPTEAAIDVTAWRCGPGELAGRHRVPIGAPVSNVRVHILDRRLRELPIGAPGELHIGGVQVARCYHNRPGLTAQRFVADPFGPPGSRMYATGDLARWCGDGVVEFLGRIDGQVKLRGLRIELGEIEATLRDQPGVRDAAAAVHEVAPGDRRIIGYITGGEQPDAASLRAALKARLPDYMVPARFVALPALPLTPSGKLDRAALPVPEPAAATGGDRVPPRTAAEREIASIWRDVLGVADLGIDDDFFDLGGHSLLATQVVVRMRNITGGPGRQVGVMDLFQHPTVRELAALAGQRPADGPRALLYELTRPVPPEQRVCSYVCVPYGGGSAVVYQAVADRLPAGHSLYSVAIPGHDVGLDEDALPFGELARRCTEEILARVDGPLVLYGHCGVGGALIIELARLLEAAGRPVEAVYAGGVFPFARPRGILTRVRTWAEDLASNRNHAAWLKSMGVDMDELDPAQADRIIGNMRRDGKSAEEHFTRLLELSPQRLRAPVISVVGERDPITDYYAERYREWRFITGTAALVVLDEAGHFFLRHRADDLAGIITGTHHAIEAAKAGGPAGHRLAGDVNNNVRPPSGPLARPADSSGQAPPGQPPPSGTRPADSSGQAPPGRPPAGVPGRWRLAGVASQDDAADPGLPAEPGMRRFALVALGQFVSITGSSLTGWAIPVWLYLTTHSLLWFGLSGASAVIPMLLGTPLAGAFADRFDRRRVIMIAACAAASVELAFAAALWAGHAALGLVYVLLWLLAFAGTFQRVAFTAAIPQLAPKRYLGHANGVAQLINGMALLFVPLLAAGLLAVIGLRGILLIDVISYAFAIGVLAATRFPDLMGRRRKETFREQILGGARIVLATPAFRAMLIFYSIGNLLYAVPVLLVTPLVLSFGSVGEVGRAAFAEGLGALAGGGAMAVWGGPRRRRMVVNIAAIALSGGFVMLTGWRASMLVVLAGVFGTAAALALANGIYLTIIQVKVPQRYLGRMIALNQAITWSTLPIGFVLLLPLTSRLSPLLTRGGALAGTVGRVIGTGPGRGLGFAFVLCGLAMTVNALAALGVRRLSRLDEQVPDSLPDDLIGAQVLAARADERPVSAGAAERSGGPARAGTAVGDGEPAGAVPGAAGRAGHAGG